MYDRAIYNISEVSFVTGSTQVPDLDFYHKAGHFCFALCIPSPVPILPYLDLVHFVHCYCVLDYCLSTVEIVPN